MKLTKMKLKNIVAAIVLVLFAASILPAALAKEEQNSPVITQGKMMDGLKEKKAQEMKQLEREQGLQQKKKEVHEQMQELREMYHAKKEIYLKNREALHEMRLKAACKEDSESCMLEKEKFYQGVEQHLLKTLELIDASLERLVQQVESSPVLTEEERLEALASLQSWEERLDAKRADLEALDGQGITRKELKAQTKELKKLWHETRSMQRKLLASMISARHENIVNTYLRYGDKLEERLEQLKTGGADITEAEVLLADYRQKVEEVKITSSEAKLAWQEAKVQGTTEALQSAREKQEQFRKVSQEVKQVLRDLLQELRELQKMVNALVSDAEE